MKWYSYSVWPVSHKITKSKWTVSISVNGTDILILRETRSQKTIMRRFREFYKYTTTMKRLKHKKITLVILYTVYYLQLTIRLDSWCFTSIKLLQNSRKFKIHSKFLRYLSWKTSGTFRLEWPRYTHKKKECSYDNTYDCRSVQLKSYFRKTKFDSKNWGDYYVYKSIKGEKSGKYLVFLIFSLLIYSLMS